MYVQIENLYAGLYFPNYSNDIESQIFILCISSLSSDLHTFTYVLYAPLRALVSFYVFFIILDKDCLSLQKKKVNEVMSITSYMELGRLHRDECNAPGSGRITSLVLALVVLGRGKTRKSYGGLNL